MSEYTIHQSGNSREWLRFIVEVLGFIVVVILACLAYQQFSVTRDQMKAAERAWVTLKAASIADSKSSAPDKPLETAPGETPLLSVELQNTGHSPAREATILAAADFIDQLPTGDSFPIAFLKIAAQQKLDTNSIGRSVLGPGASMSTTVPLGRPLTAQEVVELKSGRSIAIFGMIDYDDVFAQHHVTTFCYRTINGTHALAPCARWNYAD